MSEEDPDLTPPIRWLLPMLGVVMFLFTLLNGVPWISKAEFLLYREGRDAQWRIQYEMNQRFEHRLELLESMLRTRERGQ